MSSTVNESTTESGVTPSQSEMAPASSTVISTVNELVEPINQVSLPIEARCFACFFFVLSK